MTRARRVGLIGAALVAALIVVGLQQAALSQLRGVEADYVAGRQVTACASRKLAPFASPRRDDLDDLPAAIEQIVTEALTEAESARAGAHEAVMPFPRLRQASASVRDALDAEVGLYRAMVDDPQNSRDELDQLGAANRTAEEHLAAARRLLLVGDGDGWAARNSCRQASSASSSK